MSCGVRLSHAWIGLNKRMITAVQRLTKMNRNLRTFVGGALSLAVLIASFIALNAETAAVPESGNLRAAGTLDFKVSCAPEVRSEFIRGLALLHSFFYEEARRIFTEVAAKDPSCAMAQWGIAMTWWHPIWTPPTSDEMTVGKGAIEKAMATKPGSDLERGFIKALNAYYHTPDGPATGEVGQSCHGPVGSADRVIVYEKAMRQVLEKYPNDFETQTFYALAVLAVGYATPADTTLSNQLKAAAILEKLWHKNPHHPGVTHYLIHSYDYPALAERGLPAARSYGSIAPGVPHALHMPSHIFTRLGMWEESIAANRSSADASRAYAAMRHRDATEAEELHALDYMAYSYLQEGQDAKAKEIVDFVATVKKTNPELEFSAAYALAAIPSRYALERNAWSDAATLPVPKLPLWVSYPSFEGLIEYCHALGRAHTGDIEGARKAIDRMRQLHDSSTDPRLDYFKRHLELQIQAASAWVACSEGKKEEAVSLLRRAAEAEDILGKHPVSPGALVPAREQLGDLLLTLGQPKEAEQEFEAALKIYPGRFCGLYGAAQAAERIGDREKANRYYAKLRDQTTRADGSRSEIAQLREYRTAEAATAQPK
jgi:tetratricopeptide (TPR) repeat protein